MKILLVFGQKSLNQDKQPLEFIARPRLSVRGSPPALCRGVHPRTSVVAPRAPETSARRESAPVAEIPSAVEPTSAARASAAESAPSTETAAVAALRVDVDVGNRRIAPAHLYHLVGEVARKRYEGESLGNAYAVDLPAWNMEKT